MQPLDIKIYNKGGNSPIGHFTDPQHLRRAAHFIYFGKKTFLKGPITKVEEIEKLILKNKGTSFEYVIDDKISKRNPLKGTLVIKQEGFVRRENALYYTTDLEGNNRKEHYGLDELEEFTGIGQSKIVLRMFGATKVVMGGFIIGKTIQ